MTAKLPKWIEAIRHPDYATANCCVPCDRFHEVVEALSIAIEAISDIATRVHCEDCWKDPAHCMCYVRKAEMALKRIEELGGDGE